ncbi:hypothetical protein TPHA_0L01180 [Tetrapisispora phaffii CBS 4417]|uniref:Sodium/calcium exchanger membrane region domain-containing protein n=1 Tax=Tetrapisispora phaffii (strain ATCC 24235 / CBS 4417 / NBRC 1672 / NRRL Y-8282 / UCD 70-5) TaxID=1071381 RepID=G8BZZ7_TETPH|nr:hypothetical protein TPHA_0L01180 [Tetrapisispora phaffii CBS 4417]CCE65475.1 hypothetical protein TPHA_0L01180 [Tetrapisispora phaffii CBS 4417]
MSFNYRCFIAFAYSFGILLIILSYQYSNITKYFIEPSLLLTGFIVMGLVTSDFLSQSLSILSDDYLKVSHKISGMTLLALGNALPDIISAYQSMSSGATSLTIGQLIGATFFVITIVIGSMGFTKAIYLTNDCITYEDCPEENISLDDEEASDTMSSNIIFYNRNRYLHYIIPFSILILITLYIISDGILTFKSSILLTVGYCSFVIFQIYEESIHNFYSTLTEETSLDNHSSIFFSNRGIAASHSHLSLDHIITDPRFSKEELKHQIKDYMRHTYNGWVRMSLRDCIDVWDTNLKLNDDDRTINETDANFINTDTIINENTPLFTQSDYHSVFPESSNQSSSVEPTVDQNVLSLSTDISRLKVPEPQNQIKKTSSPSHTMGLSYTPQPLIPTSSNELSSISSLHPDHFCGFELFNKLLYPTVDMSIFERLTLLFTAPSSLLLHILIPTFTNYGVNYDIRYYKIIQLAAAPIVVYLGTASKVNLWIFLYVSVVSVILFLAIKFRYLSDIKHTSTIIAFILSLVIISNAVTLNLQILTSWASDYGLSGTILGLTIYAWGNSIGDLISNVMFVQVGIFDIALSACFGSPLLYFVCGLGVNGIILLLKLTSKTDGSIFNSHLKFELDAHFKVTSFGTICAILVLIGIVPLNNWKIDRKISFLLFMIYALVSLVNIYIEL